MIAEFIFSPISVMSPPENSVSNMEMSVVINPENDEKIGNGKKLGERETNLLYGINENPPWYLCIFLAFQHYLTMVSLTVFCMFFHQKVSIFG